MWAGLARLTYDLPGQRAINPCPTCDGFGVDDDGGQCGDRTVGIVADMEWSVCPYGLLTAPFWRGVMMLDHARRVSPLSGWPADYSAGVVSAMLSLHAAEMERNERERRRAMSRRG